jgi:hypothetical protein
MLNIEDGGDGQGVGISGDELLKTPGPGVGCRAIDEDEETELCHVYSSSYPEDIFICA